MARHGFGQGEYKYFDYPLPDIISRFRTSIYRHLAPVANRWNETMGIEARYPKLTRCFSNDVMRPAKPPTTLLLLYVARMTTIACIRTSMASMYSRCRWQCCFRSRERISPEASSC